MKAPLVTADLRSYLHSQKRGWKNTVAMDWPYEIITDLTDQDKAARRESLDAAARYAHYSAFVPAAIYVVYRLGSSVLGTSRGSANYEPVASSARNRRGASGVAATRRRVRWWLSEPVSKTGDRGHRDEWVFGIGWALWLLYLSVNGTGTGKSTHPPTIHEAPVTNTPQTTPT